MNRIRRRIRSLRADADGALAGLAAANASYARAGATRSPLGEDKAANEPVADRPYMLMDHATAETSWPLSSSIQQMRTGFDWDGQTPVTLHSRFGIVTPFVGGDAPNADNALAERELNDFTTPEDGTHTYDMDSYAIAFGVTWAACRRLDGATVQGTALFRSLDYAATLTPVFDGSGNISAPDFSPGKGRGNLFTLTHCPAYDDLLPDGSPKHVAVATGDYLFQGGNPDGGVVIVAVQSRETLSNDWSFSNAATWTLDTGQTGVHIHSAFPTLVRKADGSWLLLVYVFQGDSGNACHVLAAEGESPIAICNGIANGSIAWTHNPTWHGSRASLESGSGTYDKGRRGLQSIDGVPGRTPQSCITGGDFFPEAAVEVRPSTLFERASDVVGAKADTETLVGGIVENSRQLEVFAVACGDMMNRRRYAVGIREKGTPTNYLAYSEDGTHWSIVWHEETPDASSHVYPGFHGDNLVVIDHGVGILKIPLKKPYSVRPILIGESVDNFAQDWSSPIGVSTGMSVASYASAGATVSYPATEFDGNASRHAGEELPRQPPGLTEVLRIQADPDNVVAGGGEYGRFNIDPDAGLIDGDPGWMVFALHPLVDGCQLDPQAGSFVVQGTTPTANRNWTLIAAHGDDIYSNINSAAWVWLQNNWNDEASSPADFLFQLVHFGKGTTFPMFPVAAGASGGNKALLETESFDVRGSWAARLALIWPEHLFVREADLYPMPLFSVRQDANNYINVSAPALDQLKVSVVVGGAAAVEATISSGLYFERNYPVRIIVYPDGANTKIEAVTAIGKETATASSAVLPRGDIVLRASNHDQSAVGAFGLVDLDLMDGMDLTDADRERFLFQGRAGDEINVAERNHAVSLV